MKSEPHVFSIDDLQRLRRSAWDGVRNYQARNFIQEMQVSDLVLFYHSSTEPKAVVGLARVVKEAYPDPTQFDAESDHYDKASRREAPRWCVVDVEFVEKFSAPITLDEMKHDTELSGMLVIRKGMRLSVQPVKPAHAKHILKRAAAKARWA